MYTTKSRIQNYLMITIADSFDDQINEWIDAADTYIDNYCNRTFEQESATSKLYDGSGTSELLIDDLLTLTKIETLDEDNDVDETLDSTDDYWLYPANETPKNRIKINTANASIAVFPKGHQNIKITGTFGQSTSVPEDIRLVATKLVAGIISERNLDIAGEIKSEKLGEYSITLQDIEKQANHLGINQILDRYRLIPI